jgi:hypothetical protein
MFDSKAMLELQHLARDRYQRNGGGGAHKVYASSKAYYDARGYKEMSPFAQACVEMLHRYRQVCQIQREHFRLECLTSNDGFYHGEDIPF